MTHRGRTAALLGFAVLMTATACGSVGDTTTVTVTVTDQAAAAAATTTTGVSAADLAKLQAGLDEVNATLTTALGDTPATKLRENLKVPDASPDDTPEQAVHKLVDFVFKDSSQYWARVFRNSNVPWSFPRYHVLEGDTTMESACRNPDGSATIAGDEDNGQDGSMFYCPADDTVYVDVPFMVRHVYGPHVSDGQDRKGGDFGVALIVAHEMGHAVQTKLDIQLPDDALTVKPTELQADCFAGVWTSTAYDENLLDDDDISEAIQTAEDGGDYLVFNPGHHGFPSERVEAFRVGFVNGEPDKCTLTLGDDTTAGDATLPSVTVSVEGPATPTAPTDSTVTGTEPAGTSSESPTTDTTATTTP
jgi:predicted metalloprotease